MALTRSMLKGMGLTEEQVGAIIDEHTSTIEGLKADRDKYKAEAESIPKLTKEIEDLKASVETAGGNDWQEKYEKEHNEYEQYKAKVAEDAREAECKSLYRALLIENGVGENHIDSILRVTDFKDIKKGDDGQLENKTKLTEDIKSAWSGFITSTGVKGAGVENPPTGGGSMTKESFSKLPLAEQMKYANEHPNEVDSLL